MTNQKSNAKSLVLVGVLLLLGLATLGLMWWYKNSTEKVLQTVNHTTQKTPETPEEAAVLAFFEEKQFLKPSKQKGEMHIQTPHFLLSFSEKNRQAHWVSYRIEAQYLSNKSPLGIPAKPLAGHEDLPTLDEQKMAKKGLVLGNLLPIADMKIDRETMTTANAYPLKVLMSEGFRDGIWRSLGQFGRNLARERGDLLVFSGAIFEASKEEDAKPPKAFYRIYLDFKPGQWNYQAYLIPAYEMGKTSLNDYQTSLEHLSGILPFEIMDCIPPEMHDAISEL